ncbi:MAG TPA: R3H domain-containing nucleic acid-binding protein [Pyrinomonadaceae bacterium]|nr:R3H domain-containing nucleic acid-binding protein [Pyrinomonadaceae bacterium]
MREVCTQAQEFLNAVFDGVGLKLHADAEDASDGCLLKIDGSDSSLLMSEGGELLDSLQHLVYQAVAGKLERGERITCDAENFRSTRDAELRAMARHAAERVRKTGEVFMFGPMIASERRVIHLSLSDEKDLQTESIGEGPTRRLKVSPKSAE